MIGASKIARDITEAKRAQRQLQQAQAELKIHAEKLERAVAERTAKLRETIAELEAFSYSLSHDMRTPLRSIQSFSQFVLGDYGDQLDEAGRGYLEKVVDSSRRMDRLISDVLSLTRMSRQEIQVAAVDVQGLIQQLVSERPELQLPRARVAIQGRLPRLLGHEVSLTQCLTNLLDNAVKFVAPGIVPEVRIYATTGGGTVRIWVEDNGIGIELAALGRVFEMFHRPHTQAGYEGTGLGLAIVRKAVERMGGQVGVESTPGKGSRFWFQLPPAEAA